MQIERVLITQIWAHAVEHPNDTVYGTVHFPEAIQRMGALTRTHAWVCTPQNVGKNAQGFYQSFDTLPPLPDPAGFPEGFVFLGAYVGIKGVLEMQGYRVEQQTIVPLHFTL